MVDLFSGYCIKPPYVGIEGTPSSLIRLGHWFLTADDAAVFSLEIPLEIPKEINPNLFDGFITKIHLQDNPTDYYFKLMRQDNALIFAIRPEERQLFGKTLVSNALAYQEQGGNFRIHSHYEHRLGYEEEFPPDSIPLVIVTNPDLDKDGQ